MDVEDTQTEEKPVPMDIGALLCEARDNLELDSQRIATELNLAECVIKNIEQNVFVQDIPIAFIRGYVKAYATKVGLDTTNILAEFDKQAGIEMPSLTRVKSISKFGANRKELNSGSLVIKVISGIVILLFLSYGGYELWKGFAATEDSDELGYEAELVINDPIQEYAINPANSDEINLSNDSMPSENSDKLDNSDSSDNSDSLGNTNEPQQQNIETANASQSVAEIPDLSVPSSSAELATTESSQDELGADQENYNDDESSLVMTTLVFDFSADCWVNITDGRGEVLALGVKRAGKHMPIEGVKPFNIVLGDPSVVSLQYDNQSYDLSGYRAGRRAEIILN